MKRLTSLLLAVFMACSMFVISASASYVYSPEYTDMEDMPIPMAPMDPMSPMNPMSPMSPQTGDPFGVAGFAVIALLCGTVAVVSTKKAAKCS